MGRLKGGWAKGLGVARCAPQLVTSELSADSIRGFLLADVVAYLLQFEPDGGYGISARPEMLSRKSSALCRTAGRWRSRSFLSKIRSPMLLGASEESRCTCAHGPASGALQLSGTPFAEPARERSCPVVGVLGQRSLCAAVWARTQRGTCSPILNGIGSDKLLTFILSLRFIKPLGEDSTL